MGTKNKPVSGGKSNWSGDVTEHEKWHSPPGLFNKDPEEIATVLKDNSVDEKQAMSRLTFYINRAGSNLSDEDRDRLNEAKDAIRDAYDE